MALQVNSNCTHKWLKEPHNVLVEPLYIHALSPHNMWPGCCEMGQALHISSQLRTNSPVWLQVLMGSSIQVLLLVLIHPQEPEKQKKGNMNVKRKSYTTQELVNTPISIKTRLSTSEAAMNTRLLGADNRCTCKKEMLDILNLTETEVGQSRITRSHTSAADYISTLCNFSFSSSL